MTAFDHFSPAALTFLRDLKANNRRDWFQANKPVYEAEIRDPAKHFGVAMSAALEALTGAPHLPKIYRINRDIRFSKDKTPYNTHLHLSFAPQPATANTPMWFFGLNTEKLSLGCGVFQFDKPGLAAFRARVSGTAGAQLIDLTARLAGKGVRVSPPELKRVPPGFDAAHPHSEVLRRKGFAAWIDLPDTRFVTAPGLVKRTTQALERLHPVFDILRHLT
ncbi:DUF2461 domain-containing protein [Roseobacter sinensis]|uniref:DUF2461 domain-containing protein n=1 Tax=Roseobacter sinensis TaxID=2931391 RepID=A0ABT3BAX6_9RHOB|nr:DUF2461 domain-containing protein [Roseobacter sp. WL0113]MCV3270733.1 DUF2461 domain-containing protein [Roseobacter sp. WL0113]